MIAENIGLLPDEYQPRGPVKAKVSLEVVVEIPFPLLATYWLFFPTLHFTFPNPCYARSLLLLVSAKLGARSMNRLCPHFVAEPFLTAPSSADSDA